MKEKESLDELNKLSSRIIGCAREVHKELGPGLLESVYEICLAKELLCSGLSFERQVILPVVYKADRLNLDFRIDILVENEIVIELKAIDAILPVHEAQLITYLKLSGKRLGLLINFNQATLKDGIKRRLNGY